MTEDAFEPPMPGSWTGLERAEANHEASHALASYLLDLEVYELRIDRPLHPADNKPGFVYGHCIHETPPRDHRWKSVAVALAPLVVTNRCPEFPPRLDSNDGDEATAARIVHDIGMTEQEWDTAVEIITCLLRMPTSKRKLTRLAGALLEQGALPGEEVQRLLSYSGARESAR